MGSHLSVKKRALAWATAWRELRCTLGLSYSLFNRPGTTSTVVICVNTAQGLVAFARRLVFSAVPHEIWADACADQLEDQARKSFGLECPCIPQKAKFKKQSALLMDQTAMFKLQCLDARSTEVLSLTYNAQQSQDTHEFCAARSGYRDLVSVMCCSFKE